MTDHHKMMVLLFAMAVALFCFIPSPSYADNEYAEVKKTLEGVRIDSIRFLENLGMYEVVSKTQAVYVTKDMRYLIIGRVIDIQSKRDLTADRINSLRRIDFTALKLNNAIKMGSGKTAIAVFTDPNCGYCKQLHSELAKLTDVTVYNFLYPLAASKPGVIAQSAAIWCSDNRQSALDAVFSGKKVVTPTGSATTACKSVIEENVRFGREHGLTSTPSVILANGQVITGFRTVADLSKMIKEVEKP